MCRESSQIFWWRLHFFIQIFVLAACLQKTGGFACNWPLASAKFAYVFLIFASVWLSHPQFQRIFQTKYLGHCVLKLNKELDTYVGRMGPQSIHPIECQASSPVVRIGSSHPRMLLPPLVPGGWAQSLVGEGAGGPIRTKDRHSDTLGIV
jgi:hypothetical protein